MDQQIGKTTPSGHSLTFDDTGTLAIDGSSVLGPSGVSSDVDVSVSSTVTGPPAFGAAAAVGSAATASKGDHIHGLPADPTTDLRATTGATTLIYPEQHATAGGPAYVKGAVYFDTTLNKLRVGGATAWETITSA